LLESRLVALFTKHGFGAATDILWMTITIFCLKARKCKGMITRTAFFFFCLAASVCFCTIVRAQRLEVGAGAGTVNYKGDISPGINLDEPHLGGQVFLRHNPGKAISLTYSFMLGRFGASDKNSDDPFAQQRNFSFGTRLVEASAIAEYNFLDYRDEQDRTNFTPYLFGGLALFRFEPQQNYRPTYDLYQIGIPFGVGMKYVLGGSWNLGVAFGARKTFTDYLDDLGGIDTINRFRNGNPNAKDMYFYTALSISYTFYKVRCPDFY